MKANKLTPGQKFKLKGQRKFRTVSSVHILKPTDKVPREKVGKVLIVFNGCRQIELNADWDVIISE